MKEEEKEGIKRMEGEGKGKGEGRGNVEFHHLLFSNLTTATNS